MSSKGTGKMGGREEPSLERGKFRSKGLKEGDDDVRVFFKEPHNVRGKDRLLCFVSEHTRYPFVVVYNDAKWNLEKRFSDFAELHAALDEAFKNNEDVTLPEFPPKKYFGSLSPALIKESEVLQCRSLREFLETPDIVGKDKHKEYDF